MLPPAWRQHAQQHRAMLQGFPASHNHQRFASGLSSSPALTRRGPWAQPRTQCAPVRAQQAGTAQQGERGRKTNVGVHLEICNTTTSRGCVQQSHTLGLWPGYAIISTFIITVCIILFVKVGLCRPTVVPRCSTWRPSTTSRSTPVARVSTCRVVKQVAGWAWGSH